MSIIGDNLGLIIVIALFLVPLIRRVIGSISDSNAPPDVRRDSGQGSSASDGPTETSGSTRKGIRNRFEEARESLAERVRQNEATFERPSPRPEMRPESVAPERFSDESASLSQEQRWEQSQAPEARPELVSGVALPARLDEAVAANEAPLLQPKVRSVRSGSVQALLSSRRGLRQAIIAQEVLGPPKSMRDPSDGSGGP